MKLIKMKNKMIGMFRSGDKFIVQVKYTEGGTSSHYFNTSLAASTYMAGVE